MGYVPVFCCACAGPVGHGYGIDGALEEAAEAANDGAAKWALDAPTLRWLEALRVLQPAHGDKGAATSGVLEYEDYGLVTTEDGGFVGLNPIAWSEVDGSRPGVSLHCSCLELLEQRLSAMHPPVAPGAFAAAYHRKVDEHWAQHKRQAGGPEAQAGAVERELLLLNALLPGVDYGEGVAAKCEQYYEFSPGSEWLLHSPKTAEGGRGAEANRNRERIDGVVSQLLNQLGPQCHVQG